MKRDSRLMVTDTYFMRKSTEWKFLTKLLVWNSLLHLTILNPNETSYSSKVYNFSKSILFCIPKHQRTTVAILYNYN